MENNIQQTVEELNNEMNVNNQDLVSEDVVSEMTETVVEPESVEDEAEELECDIADCDEVDESGIDVSKVKITGDEWVNEDLVPVTKIKCLVPRKLLNSIRDIEQCVNRKFSGKPEFSIYIHGEYDEHGNLVVGEDFYIPKQKVSGATVDYEEQPEKYYNGCLHKHPDGCKSFSGTDKRYINSNFEFSLLYVCGKLHTGIVNINYAARARIQVGVDIDVMDSEGISINIDNIMEPERKVVTGFSAAVTTPVKKFTTFTPPVLPGFDMDDKTSRGGIILPHCVRDNSVEEVESEEDPIGFSFMCDPEKAEGIGSMEVDDEGPEWGTPGFP